MSVMNSNCLCVRNKQKEEHEDILDPLCLNIHIEILQIDFKTFFNKLVGRI